MKSNTASVFRSLWRFAARETVLTAALILAVISSFFVPVDMRYLNYPDWETLCLMFSLMCSVAGFKKAGVLQKLGVDLLNRAETSASVTFILTMLPFFFSMLITNDVALITFVPFTITVLRISQREDLAARIILLQTLATNLGSMLTPMGNPQNLYIYNKFSLGFGQLVLTMLPYTVVSLICLAAASVIGKKQEIRAVVRTEPLQKSELFWCVPAAVICLLSVFKAVPSPVTASVIALFLLFYDRKLLPVSIIPLFSPL